MGGLMDGLIDGRVGFCFEYGARLGFMVMSGGVLLFSAWLWYFRGAHMVVDVLGRRARARMVSGTELGFLGATILISLAGFPGMKVTSSCLRSM
jgi:hypothetical protein